VDDWLATFDVRISPFVNLKITLEEEEIVKLGKKSEEEYPFTTDFSIVAVVAIVRFLSFYSAPQCSHCKRCTSYSNSVCLPVRPSVRLFVTRRYCVKTTARSTVQFALSDSKMCLVL